MPTDPSFAPDTTGLTRAVDFLSRSGSEMESEYTLPPMLPDGGIGEADALALLAPLVLGRAANLGADLSLAHMDPPTPWITWALHLWNAALNQNLLHPSTAPFAREAEELVVGWLAPFYGMDGGHMLPGSTLANLTAIWSAREVADVRRVVASEAAHLSIRKAAAILGLEFVPVAADRLQRLDRGALPHDLSDACLVLTAGTTNSGAVDSMATCGRAAWTHVDAAWAGPLRLSARYAALLDGIDRADSVSISAHKLLFQPKESALVLFRETARAHAGISFSGNYLAAPNVGLLGSRGAPAMPLIATLLAWGRDGVAARIDRCMQIASMLAGALSASDAFELFGAPETGVVVFRPLLESVDDVLARLTPGLVSTTVIDGQRWLRCVAANPNADADAIAHQLLNAHGGMVE